MSTDLSKEKERLRQYLNPSIRGPNTDAILESLADGSCHLIDNVEAINDQLYIVTAAGKYLDQRMADRDLTRPENVGLDDEVFRQIGIEVANRKQVRDLIHKILEFIYDDDFTRATSISNEFEPYQLNDGDTLILQFDDEDPVEVVFNSSQFSSIASATAQEVADAITKEIRRQGRRGSARSRDDGLGEFVQLISQTNGPSSTIKVLGGPAQNELRFPQIRPTTGDPLTEWTLTLVSGGSIRATWTGGPNPSIGRTRKGDYVNIFGGAFSVNNQGTYTITKVQGGLINNAFVEFENVNGTPQITLQGTADAILFYNPFRSTLSQKTVFAAAYQTENRILEVFLPATTKVVRRERQGAAHLHESGASTIDDLGPYVFDTSKPYLIGEEECLTTIKVDSSTERIVEVDDSSNFPDAEGDLIFGFGTSLEEGPVSYIARPSSNTLLIDPSYRFKNVHEIGTDIALVSQNFAYNVKQDASDYPFYGTDIVSGRVYAEDLIKLVSATGINVIITILYPNDIGLGKWGKSDISEKRYVWGEDAGVTLFERED